MQALEHIDDPRSPSNGTRHDFRELLVVAICAMLSDNDTFEEMVAWARYKQDWLRGFLKLANGIPSEDTFIRVFRLLDPRQFEQAFRDWAGDILPALSHETLAIDGKTLRGSGSGGERAIHMVSAFATQAGLVLGQEKVHGKSTKSRRSPSCWKACTSRACWPASMPWVASATLRHTFTDRKVITCWRSKVTNPRCKRRLRRR